MKIFLDTANVTELREVWPWAWWTDARPTRR
jgi:hypothetical protein